MISIRSESKEFEDLPDIPVGAKQFPGSTVIDFDFSEASLANPLDQKFFFGPGAGLDVPVPLILYGNRVMTATPWRKLLVDGFYLAAADVAIEIGDACPMPGSEYVPPNDVFPLSLVVLEEARDQTLYACSARFVVGIVRACYLSGIITTDFPTRSPTIASLTATPTARPSALPTPPGTSGGPTAAPSATPGNPSGPITAPSPELPTSTPTQLPPGVTDSPTESPTGSPISQPTSIPTSPPTNSPTSSPTSSPTIAQTPGTTTGSPTSSCPSGQEAFETNEELRAAAVALLVDGEVDEVTGTYGAISDWCVGGVTNFDGIFMEINFNEDISSWVSNVHVHSIRAYRVSSRF